MSYSQRTVTVDTSRLNDADYLKSVKGLSEDNLSEKYMSLQDYIEQEQAKSDMFLFLKYVCPTSFKQFYKRMPPRQAWDGYDQQLASAELLLSSKPQQEKKSRFSELSANLKNSLKLYLRTRFSRKKSSDLPPIEVFDVMIKAGPN